MEVVSFAYAKNSPFSALPGYEILFPLQSTPYIQLERYWELCGTESVRSMGPNRSETVTVQTTVGATEETTNSFGATIGISVEVGGKIKIIDVSTSINTEFSYEYTRAEQNTYEKTVTKTTTISTGDNEHVILALWRLVNEIRIVDENGNDFYDPNYTFAPELYQPLIFVNPTDYRDMTYKFIDL